MKRYEEPSKYGKRERERKNVIRTCLDYCEAHKFVSIFMVL